MDKDVTLFPRARIPYGTWGSSYFPAWQTSALAEVNIGQFAGEAMNRILGLRKVRKDALDYLIIGSTIPWHWKFWNAPLVASCLGQQGPGLPHGAGLRHRSPGACAGCGRGGERRPRRGRRADLRPDERLAGGGLSRSVAPTAGPR